MKDAEEYRRLDGGFELSEGFLPEEGEICACCGRRAEEGETADWYEIRGDNALCHSCGEEYKPKEEPQEEPCDYCGEIVCELPLGHEGFHHGFNPSLGEELTWE